MGFETHVFAWKCGDIGEKNADYFYPISIAEKEKILKICESIKISAIVSIGSDFAVHTVNYVSRIMGFPCNSVECEKMATNKYAMRMAFLEAGVPVPKFTKANVNFDFKTLYNYTFPLIVKPTDRSGSRGIFKSDTLKDVRDAIAIACKESWKHEAIIEEFFEGNEYSCESISYAGKHHILAYTQKFTTGAPHFIETGHKQPANFPKYMEPLIRDHITKALDALDIKYGASHTEFKILDNNQIRIIEIGARMGGDYIGSDLVPYSTGYDYMRMVIDISLNRPICWDKMNKPHNMEVRFIFNTTDYDYMQNIIRNQPQKVVRATCSNRNIFEKVTDSSNRHGYIIIKD